MLQPRKDEDTMEERVCKRCRHNPPAVVVRSEHICRDCFTRYVATKATKRMESYRVRGSSAPQTLLLPLSLGVSSVVLLHLLDAHLRSQLARMNRTGYELHVLHVDASGFESGAPLEPSTLFAKIQETYPGHTYSLIPLSQVFSHDNTSLADLFPPNAHLQTDSPTTRLAGLLSSLPSPTSRVDTLCTLRSRLVQAFARASHCPAILWADSTTRLAEKTLAETAKGRGGSLPWLVSDDHSSSVKSHYPLRDVLRPELLLYSTLLSPPLTHLLSSSTSSSSSSFPTATPAVSVRNTTIDALMAAYVSSVEKAYPSVVANVVRTAAKLCPPAPVDGEAACGLCRVPVGRGDGGLHGIGWGGDQADTHSDPRSATDGEEGGGDEGFCYGCARSLLGARSSSSSTARRTP
ncbi:MAG: cytoplasmic tRNA 2-thiolation protein 2 [Thelocarpon impressellum]|nr:MAG: cytoplasmic tRNA 2-thiolation protein 2 [Thelocarpon impressellum]